MILDGYKKWDRKISGKEELPPKPETNISIEDTLNTMRTLYVNTSATPDGGWTYSYTARVTNG